MSIYSPNTVAYAWELLYQLTTQQLLSFYQKPWRLQACVALYRAHQSALHLGFSPRCPQLEAELDEQQRQQITQPPTPTSVQLRASKHKDAKLREAYQRFAEALQRQDVNEAIARIFYLKNAHARQRAWLTLGRHWLAHNNVLGAAQMLEKLSLPQLQDEKLLFQAELSLQNNEPGDAARYLECLMPAIRRHSYLKHGSDFLSRCLYFKATLWSKGHTSPILSLQEAKHLCADPEAMKGFYQNLGAKSINRFMEAQRLPVQKRMREALQLAKISEQCDVIIKCFAQAPSTPMQATTPEEAYWLGAICQNQRAPQGELRAFFDAGKATHPEHRSTEVLLRASKRELEGAVKQNQLSNAVTARLQCLSSLSRDSISDWLRALFVQHPSDLDPSLFGAILQRSPKQARGLFLEEFLRVTESGAHTRAQLEKLQRAKVFSGPFCTELRTLQQKAQASFGVSYGVRWVGCLLRAWWRRFGQAPSSETLRSMSEGFLALSETQRQDILSLEPAHATQQLLQQGEAMTLRLLSLAPDELLGQLNSKREHLRLLQCFAPEALPHLWSDSRWATTLAALKQQARSVDLWMVNKLAKRLSPINPKQLEERLLLGQCPVGGLASPLSVEAPYSLRYLDKRQDLFAFLRLADAVPCCFSSLSHKGSYHNQRWIFDLWRDPLSFCFWIEEHSEERGAIPFGFVFGSFALQENRPVVMLNGIYLKRQKPTLREKILTTLEASFCIPLNIKQVAISNRYAGCGPLPSSYHATPTRVTRLRALRDASGIHLTRVYDDISHQVNQEFTTSYSTYWKQLA